MKEPSKTVFLDTETTGFNPDEDDILEIAIVDSDGKTLLNSLVRPEKKTEWPEAKAVNGITPEMVASAPTLDELEARIKAALRHARVVAYNMAFDLGFLKPAIAGWIPGHDYFPHCAMRRFAVMRGVWDEKRGDYKRWKQVDAAEYVHHHWNGTAHRALADAMACRSIWQWLEQTSDDLTAVRAELKALHDKHLWRLPENELPSESMTCLVVLKEDNEIGYTAGVPLQAEWDFWTAPEKCCQFTIYTGDGNEIVTADVVLWRPMPEVPRI